MAYLPKLFRITAQTNLHVGSGNQSFGIIDNLVQRDPISNLPVIHASSLKGALREFYTLELGKDDPLVNYVFGKESTKEDRDNSPGQYRFFDGHLLSMPVRSNAIPFFRVTCPQISRQLRAFLAQLSMTITTSQEQGLSEIAGIEGGFAYHFVTHLEQAQEVLLEDVDKKASFRSMAHTQALESLAGAFLAAVDDQSFRELCDDNHLPVIARNSLENGRSTNLWYEQIVPRQSIFYTLVMVPDHEGNHFQQFMDSLCGPQLKQIGANASIGYGFCQFEPIELTPISQTT